jgi:hypothetical protein
MRLIWGKNYTKLIWQSGTGEVLSRTGSSEWHHRLERKGNYLKKSEKISRKIV